MSNISDQSNNKSWGHFSLYIGGDQHEATQFWLAMLGVIMGKAITLYQYHNPSSPGLYFTPHFIFNGCSRSAVGIYRCNSLIQSTENWTTSTGCPRFLSLYHSRDRPLDITTLGKECDPSASKNSTKYLLTLARAPHITLGISRHFYAPRYEATNQLQFE